MTAASPTLATAPTAGRLAALDVLRGIAVLLVLGRHVEQPARDVPAAVGVSLAAWRQFGWIGVDLFFVLSGFLVAGLLFREQREHGAIHVGRFLARRGCKIYPGFYALLAMTWLAAGAHAPVAAFVHEALFVQNYCSPVLWNHTWSLAVEEHFYLVLAVALGWASRDASGARMRGVPTVLASIVVMTLGLRIAAWARTPHEHLLFPTHLRLDALAVGVWLAWAWHSHHERCVAFGQRHRGKLVAVAALLLAPSLLLPVERSALVNTIGLTANAVAFGGLLLAALARPATGRGLVRGAVARVGVLSYSIYLWHMPVAKFVRVAVEPGLGHGPAMACYFVGSIAVGMALAWLIELPVLALRDRWLPARRRDGSSLPALATG